MWPFSKGMVAFETTTLLMSLSKFLRAAPPYPISYYSVCAAWCNLTIDWPQETQLVFVDAAYQLENLPMQFPIHRGSTQ